MTQRQRDFDVIVLGGGFYGCCIALLLAQNFSRVALLEKDQDLLLRASAVNQARVHGGYHYPRSIMTASRSLMNFPRFAMDFQPAIVDNFTKLYGIARHGSKINAGQFYNFFRKLGAPIELAPDALAALFNPLYIEAAFTVRELAFDCAILRKMMHRQLTAHNINLYLNTEAIQVKKAADRFIVQTADGQDYTAKIIFNCLYARINVLLKHSNIDPLPLRHEITEMALVDPGPFATLGVTIMDGPFFSLMPYPSRQLHTLSHVRYTPHLNWRDEDTLCDGHEMLRNNQLISNFSYMRRDAARYMPQMADLKYIDSLYEVKTILTRNDNDDGRPIMFREEPSLPNFFTVMGGKIDNIYDILDVIAETQTELGLQAADIAKLFSGHDLY